MNFYFAPMEGLTDSIYRKLHHKYFPGVDRYYMPFLSPTIHRTLTHREERELPFADSVPFAAVPQQILQGLRISSTHIRQLLQRGAMAEAAVFLGHPHILSGKVVHGHQLGRRLGIPTANLRLPEGLLIPPFGVYACRAIVDGVRYPAVTNIGTRPTVSGEGITVEPWILNYSGDLYDREITLEFYDWLRPEEKFPDLQSLQEAIHRDAQKTLALLDAVP